jgi:hypothetical protein
VAKDSRLFGFVQFEFAGPLALPDGRYLVRDQFADGAETVLVLRTLGAPRPPSRRRRRPRAADPDAEQQPLPLTRATVIRAFAPFARPDEAERWLDEACEAEDSADVLVSDGVAMLNRALHAQNVAAGDAHGQHVIPERAVAVRIGYGSGEETADGLYTAAREVDVWASGASKRRRREEDLRPQERVAAVLGGREQINVCETLLLRARADLDAGREREAALQLRVGLEALLAELAELASGIEDPGHKQDVGTLQERRHEAGEAANLALQGDLDAAHATAVRELLELSERVLRRRRVLRG